MFNKELLTYLLWNVSARRIKFPGVSTFSSVEFTCRKHAQNEQGLVTNWHLDLRAREH